uniref:Syntaxin 12, like n=1 Tax=Cyprinus carpio carpio TaxID=630221 RepID=A0A9J8B626_CYPCA
MSYRMTDSSHSQPRDFNNLTQTCSSNIQKITQNTGQIKSMLFQLGTRPDTPELQDRLQQMQHYTNQLAKETNRHLKDLGSLPQPQSPSEQVSSHLLIPVWPDVVILMFLFTQRQQKIQKDRLMNDFSAALNNFQVVQRRAAERERESVARARAGSRLHVDELNQDEQLVTFEKNEGWRMQAEEEPFTEEDLELIKERETNIRQLESDIVDVNQIFKDLAVMIHDQGDMIDSIEANVESAEVHVERGAEQLQQAAYHQRKSRKRMCFLALILSLVASIFAIIIWQVVR